MIKRIVGDIIFRRWGGARQGQFASIFLMMRVRLLISMLHFARWAWQHKQQGHHSTACSTIAKEPRASTGNPLHPL